MYAKFVFVCLSIISAGAIAADSQAAKTVVPRRIIAPTIAETRATRMPDGSLALSCNDRPNPKVRSLSQPARSPQINPNQQP